MSSKRAGGTRLEINYMGLRTGNEKWMGLKEEEVIGRKVRAIENSIYLSMRVLTIDNGVSTVTNYPSQQMI